MTAPQPLPANAPLALRGQAGSVWQVATGSVDVFSTDYADGHEQGARMHLLRRGVGDVFCAPAEACWPATLGLLAVGTVDCTVARLDDAAVRSHDAEVLAWASAVSGVAAEKGARDVPLADLQAVVAGTMPAAVLADAGSSTPVTTAEGVPRPGGSGTGAVPPTFEAALDAVHAVALQHFQFARLDRRQAEQQRLAARAAQDSERFQVSLTRLVRVLSPDAATADADDAPQEALLVATCRLVVGHQGIEPPAREEQPGHHGGPSPTSLLRDPVAEIARTWRLRTRAITLSDDWYHHECGSLVGFNADGRPLAILQRGARRYDVVDLERNKYKHVDATVAATLGPRAYMFYRPLPDHALGLKDLVRFILQGNRRDLGTVIVTMLVGGLLGTVVPIVTGLLVGTVIPGADRNQLVQLTLALFCTMLAVAIFSLVQTVALNRVEQNMESPLQAAVWDRLLNLPVNFFRSYTAGDLAVRAMGISALRQALTGASITSILAVVMSFFNLCLLFYYDTRLALLALCLLVVQAVAFAVALRLQIRRQRKVTEVQGRLSGLLLQLFTGISKLRVAGVESRAFGVWSRQYARQSALNYEARMVFAGMATFDAVFAILSSMAVYAVVAYGGVKMNAGTFMAFMAAFGTFLAAFAAMNGAIASVIGAIPAWERSLPILQTVPEVEPARSRVPFLSGDVEFSHVSFRYHASNEEGDVLTSPPVLNDVSIKAGAGEFIAIVGPSGAGKSTLFRLLLGFEQPESGSVYYDGESLSNLDVQAVRSQIGVVLQTGQLMSGDIFHNIVGARDLTLKDAWAAADMAGLAEEIRSMPMGMNTYLSEGAGNISGGQRQRLLIARAIVGQPRVLLFDEATSALDNFTQRKISEALEKLTATRIVIAHRLSTVQEAHRIYVLGNGRIVETGTFQELMALKGAFFDLVQRQLT